MPQSSPAALRIAQPVATLQGAEDSLASINTTQLPDRAVVVVAENDGLYLLHLDSTASPSIPDIIAPAQGGPGRWYLYSPGGGGTGEPISQTRYVDRGTTVPLDDQDGSIGAPFSTITLAITDLLALAATQESPAYGYSVLAFPGDYRSETPPTWDPDNSGGLAVAAAVPGWYSLVGSPAGANLPALAGVGTLSAYGVQLSGATGWSELHLTQSDITGAVTIAGRVLGTDSGFYQPTLTCQGLFVSGGDISATDNPIHLTTTSQIAGCTAAIGEVIFDAGAAEMLVDPMTNYWFAQASTVITNGSLVVMD